ncbi:MAG: fluoride efflux transporter CrcB [Methylococcales bacterium]|nr:fluoride efflux transporter CrcB [Methylococcales bacterium]
MNQLVAVALGGSFGAVLRFLISTGVYQWLGRGFPYGTLAVNIIGSFLIGLMTEALILERISISMEFRTAILVGLFGSLTTFSTFSLDTLYLIEQGHFAKASINVVSSVVVCVFAVWIGITFGKMLFLNTGGVVHWMGWVFPYGLLVVNTIGAFLIGIISTILLSKIALSEEHSAALVIVFVGAFITLSTLYLVLYFIEHDYTFTTHLKSILAAVATNLVVFGTALWLGLLAGRQI